MKKGMVLWFLVQLISAVLVNAAEPTGARLQGMGGAGVALPQNAGTVYYNPAGIYFQDRLAMNFTGRLDAFKWRGIWGISYLKYNRSMNNGAGFGIFRMKDTVSPEGGDAVSAQLATVYKTPLGIPAGLSLKYINEKWDDQNRAGYFSSDFGVILPAGTWLLGVSVLSFTDPGSRLFPLQVLIGLSKQFGSFLQTAFQSSFESWEDVKTFSNAELRFGVELRPGNVFSIQGGYVEASSWKYWTGGIGISSRDGETRLYAAYHWYPQRDSDDRLFISYDYFLK